MNRGSMKKFAVSLNPVTVEGLRDLARRKAVELRRTVTWVTLLREAADQLLTHDNGPGPAATTPAGAR